MNTIIANIQAWFASRGGFSHVVAGLFLLAVGAFARVPAFHDLCMHVYRTLPAWAEECVVAVAGIYAWYHASHSDAGTLAVARVINSQPNAPTAAQVDAASTK
jgi:hypothetical protein